MQQNARGADSGPEAQTEQDELTSLVDTPGLRRGAKVTETVASFFSRMKSANDKTQAVISVLEDQAYADAQRVDELRAAGSPPPLDGMPIVVKDNIDVSGQVSACGSPILRDRLAVRDAEVVRRLREAGAVILGKAHCTELMFSMRAHPDLPVCRNPWDLERIPGGSSSGSGAALAMDMCVAALGTDTGGSVRIPAAFCGVSALRPTYGTVSSSGVFPIARSFDTVGPMARSVGDIAAVLTTIAGYDEGEPRSTRTSLEPAAVDEPIDLRTVRIGVARDYYFRDVDPEIATAVDRAIEHLANQGAVIENISLNGTDEARQHYITFHLAEALSVHRRSLTSTPELFSDYVRERLGWATEVSGADLAEALEGMYRWQREIELVFQNGVDALLSPAVPCLPPTVAEAELGRHLDITRLTYPLSFARIPILCLPCGTTRGGLPIGMEIAGPACRDYWLLRLGAAYQATTDWHRRRPPSLPNSCETRT